MERPGGVSKNYEVADGVFIPVVYPDGRSCRAINQHTDAGDASFAQCSLACASAAASTTNQSRRRGERHLGTGAWLCACGIPIRTIQCNDERTEHDGQLLPARPFRRGREHHVGVWLAEFQQRGRKISFLWCGSEAEHRPGQAAAVRARSGGRSSHVSADGAGQQWYCRASRGRRGEMATTEHLAAAGRQLCAFATVWVGTKQFSGSRGGELPVLRLSW